MPLASPKHSHSKRHRSRSPVHKSHSSLRRDEGGCNRRERESTSGRRQNERSSGGSRHNEPSHSRHDHSHDRTDGNHSGKPVSSPEVRNSFPQKRQERRNRFEMVKVKEEPVSDEEREHRRRGAKRPKVEPTNNNEQVSGPQSDEQIPPQPKAKPNFGLSGKLTEDANIYNGVVVKYSEPVEARKPNKKWRLYTFKGEQALPMLPIHRQSAYLLGRERRVADIPIDHPSCSKQHAALQFRSLPYRKEDGTMSRRIRPYIIDLESANGTFINNSKIEPKRYVELMEKDVIKFGFSSREYVILHEGSSTVDDDSDVGVDETSSPEHT